MAVWGDLERRLVIYNEDGPAKKPRPEDLDRYEAEDGFKLPEDYREFALLFGPGGLHRFNFRTPGFPGSEWANLGGRLVPDEYEDDEWLVQVIGDPDLARRLVVFSDVDGIGDCFAWDPADVTDPVKHDYGIYIIAHECNNPPVTRVASTFREFVLSYALGGGYERHVYGQVNELGILNSPGPIGFGQGSLSTDGD